MRPPAELIGYDYTRVADALAEKITDGRLQPGVRLPGQRELAAQYGVGLSTIRRALRELRDRGLVLTLPVKGTYVRWTDAPDRRN